MTDLSEEPVHILEWDSHFFGRKIGRVRSNCLSDREIVLVDEWVKDHHLDCVYYLANGREADSARYAEKKGFHLMDLRITFQTELKSSGLNSQEGRKIRMATAKEVPQIRQMASEYHTDSRFFADEHFNRQKCHELYETWIQRDFEEENRFLWVIDVDGRVAGYTSASICKQDHKADIGLVGIAAQWRGQGLGLQLQCGVLSELAKMSVTHVEVVTQGRNISAQNLYYKSGYSLKSIDFWYHKWYSEQD
jgi:dTDP-4-amino-4,6-dideoxy-D-galactose acyltransferase